MKKAIILVATILSAFTFAFIAICEGRGITTSDPTPEEENSHCEESTEMDFFTREASNLSNKKDYSEYYDLFFNTPSYKKDVTAS